MASEATVTATRFNGTSATKVVFANGSEVVLLGRLSKRSAISQARDAIARDSERAVFVQTVGHSKPAHSTDSAFTCPCPECVATKAEVAAYVQRVKQAQGFVVDGEVRA